MKIYISIFTLMVLQMLAACTNASEADTGWESMGMQALAAGEPDSAIEYLKQAEGLSIEGQTALGQAYLATGEVATAVEALGEAIARAPDQSETYILLAQAQRLTSDYEGAIESLTKATTLQPTNGEAHYQLGLLVAASQPQAAPTRLTLATTLAPELGERAKALIETIEDARRVDDQAYQFTLVGRALGALGEWDLAVQALRQASVLDPNYAEAWAYLGEARHNVGQDGLTELAKALALNPNSLAANILMGVYWLRQGQPEQALVYQRAAAEIEPENAALQRDLGATLAELGDIQASLIHYQRATTLAPREAIYWKALAGFLLDHEVYIDEIAVPAAMQANDLDPEDPEALVLLGRAYFLLEDQISAHSYLQLALENDHGYAPAHLHLALYYLATGENAKAEDHLQQASELGAGTLSGDQAAQLLLQYFP